MSRKLISLSVTKLASWYGKRGLALPWGSKISLKPLWYAKMIFFALLFFGLEHILLRKGVLLALGKNMGGVRFYGVRVQGQAFIHPVPFWEG